MQKYSAPAVERVLDILEIMVQYNRSFTATEMANELDVSVNSIFRIFIELEKKNYVVKNQDNSSYELSPKIYYMGNSIRERVSLVSIAHPFMKHLRNVTNETVEITTLTKDYKTFVSAQIESKQFIKFISTVGIAYDSYVSAMGKVMLAALDDNELDYYINNNEFKKMTDNTITDPEAFRQEINRVRIEGVGFDREESIPGLTCIACPVYSAGGQLECALGITAIAFRVSNEKQDEIIELVKKEAANLSNALGFHKWFFAKKKTVYITRLSIPGPLLSHIEKVSFLT